MRHSLSYRDPLKSSNAEVAFVRANFAAGRGHAWEGGRLRDRESRQRARLHFRRPPVAEFQSNSISEIFPYRNQQSPNSGKRRSAVRPTTTMVERIQPDHWLIVAIPRRPR